MLLAAIEETERVPPPEPVGLMFGLNRGQSVHEVGDLVANILDDCRRRPTWKARISHRFETLLRTSFRCANIEDRLPDGLPARLKPADVGCQPLVLDARGRGKLRPV